MEGKKNENQQYETIEIKADSETDLRGERDNLKLRAGKIIEMKANSKTVSGGKHPVRS